MRLYLGVDVGTTRTKLVIWDADRDSVIARASAATPTVQGPIERRDHETVWKTLQGLAATLPREAMRAVRGVSVASIGEEVVLLDQDGHSLMPTPCWHASLSAAPEDETQYSSHHFAYLSQEDTAALARAANFTDVGSYIAMRLAHLDASEAFMDRSHASRTGLLTSDGHWDQDAVKESGAASVGALPRLVESADPVGRVSDEAAELWGLRAEIPVHAGGHDHFCGALAAGAATPGDIFVSVGTSESVMQVIERDRASTALGARIETGYFVTPELAYVHASRPSGRRIAELLTDNGLSDIDSLYQELGQRPDKARSLAAIELDAELHQQARESAALITRLSDATQVTATSVIIGGRPAAYPVWRRIREQALSVPVKFSPEPELSGKGAAMLAARERTSQ